jgi:hypothetical protein
VEGGVGGGAAGGEGGLAEDEAAEDALVLVAVVALVLGLADEAVGAGGLDVEGLRELVDEVLVGLGLGHWCCPVFTETVRFVVSTRGRGVPTRVFSS